MGEDTSIGDKGQSFKVLGLFSESKEKLELCISRAIKIELKDSGGYCFIYTDFDGVQLKDRTRFWLMLN